jgi:phosphoenolpyruvate carboxykinase (GTP)
MNPEAGFFGVAPGTSFQTNPCAMKTIESNTIFTNVALSSDLDVWWEGMTKQVPQGLTDWTGAPYDPSLGKPAAHPNARFTVSASQCPILDPLWEDPQGVPLSAIIFGGRRSDTVPLVYEAKNWEQGVFLGAMVSSETTAAATGAVGKLRHDPFAMLPFCGYHMGDYFSHWLEVGKKASKAPSIFYVNWFRKDETGKFIWPGFGDNIRVLKWIFEREEGLSDYKESPIGLVPDEKSFDVTGLSVNRQALFAISSQEWRKEVEEMERYFSLFGDRLPPEFHQELQRLKEKVKG